MFKLSFLLGLALLAGTAAMAYVLRVNILFFDLLHAWLLAITVVTFLAYGYDKLVSRWRWSRVPERTLIMLAFCGGTLGALAALWMFRHKTTKSSFRLKFWVAIVVQAGLVVAWYWWTAEPPDATGA